MKSNDFLANLLQIIGFLAAIILAISQYFLSGQFKFLFPKSEYLYSVSTIVALVLCLAIIIGLYSNRYLIDNKNYYSRKNRDKYWLKLQEARSTNNNHLISEPAYWTLYYLGFIFIILSLISFGFLLFISDHYWRSLNYISFICLSVSSLTIFSLKIYLGYEFKTIEDKVRSNTLDKINEYFAGNIQIVTEGVNRSNMMYPTREILIIKDGDRYKIIADANDPNKYFNVEKLT